MSCVCLFVILSCWSRYGAKLLRMLFASSPCIGNVTMLRAGWRTRLVILGTLRGLEIVHPRYTICPSIRYAQYRECHGENMAGMAGQQLVLARTTHTATSHAHNFKWSSKVLQSYLTFGVFLLIVNMYRYIVMFQPLHTNSYRFKRDSPCECWYGGICLPVNFGLSFYRCSYSRNVKAVLG